MQKRPRLPMRADLAPEPYEVTLVLQPRASIAARLRPVWPMLVDAIAKGVTHAEIVEHLTQEGLPVGLRTFQSELYRYRKSLKADAA